PRLVAICRRALAVSPRDRYATARELEQDLESYLADVQSPPADTSLSELASLMRSHFSAELAEMQLFIGSNLGQSRRFVPASPGLASSTTGLVDDAEWNDQTQSVTPLSE